MVPKIIFVTGGVLSSLGKGITAGSLGALLEARNFKVHLRKFEPYINIDPGTMSPFQHGEVYVTEDGGETDLDLGHYERFTKRSTHSSDAISTGKIYSSVLAKERKGEFLGATVQVIPHITDEIKKHILNNLEKDLDFLICEIGGTVGDIEGLPFIEAIRQIANDLGRNNVLFIHLTLLPFIKSAQELKTKPSQHSVKELQSLGIQPDILVCRTEKNINSDIIKKLSLFCNINTNCIIEAIDADSIYKIPLLFHNQGFDLEVCKYFNINNSNIDLSIWQNIVKKINNSKQSVNIAVIGKYTNLQDAYKSIAEALLHAGISNNLSINMQWIEAESVTDLQQAKNLLSEMDGILVPGGYGERGMQGKIFAIQFARTNSIPLLCICLGMQLAVIEFARNVLGLKNAYSTEFSSDCTSVIQLIDNKEQNMGGTMRLGSQECNLVSQSLIKSIYNNKNSIKERHRQRYAVNKEYIESLEKNGLNISSYSVDKKIVEAIELKDHPWFLGVQFHPEFKSKPMSVHPIFHEFVANSYNHQRKIK